MALSTLQPHGKSVDSRLNRGGTAGGKSMKKSALAILGVFVAWSVMDFLIHGVILQSAYAATASLWRPMGEIKTWLMHFTVFISALAFVLIYSLFFSLKGITTGLKYGLLFGLATGLPMGYGSYFGHAYSIFHRVHLVLWLDC
jgi:hypothetical protein